MVLKGKQKKRSPADGQLQNKTGRWKRAFRLRGFPLRRPPASLALLDGRCSVCSSPICTRQPGAGRPGGPGTHQQPLGLAGPLPLPRGVLARPGPSWGRSQLALLGVAPVQMGVRPQQPACECLGETVEEARPEQALSTRLLGLPTDPAGCLAVGDSHPSVRYCRDGLGA